MKRLPFWKRPHGARRVLDIGSGHNPFHGATNLLEIDLQEGHERGGKQVHVPESTTLTVGDISALPYRTGSFDYVYASHILEHVTDPIVACREGHASWSGRVCGNAGSFFRARPGAL